MSNTPDSPATEPPGFEGETRRSRRSPPAPGRMQRGRRLVAIGFMQVAGLIGVVGLAVILGAVLVSDAKGSGWIDGLVIGAVSVILTILVLMSGRHIRRH